MVWSSPPVFVTLTGQEWELPGRPIAFNWLVDSNSDWPTAVGDPSPSLIDSATRTAL
jgi:hypothetical protein